MGGVELERLVTFTKPTRALAGELLGNVAPGERRVSQQLSDFLLRGLEHESLDLGPSCLLYM